MDDFEIACPQCAFYNRRLATDLSPPDVFLQRLKMKASNSLQATYAREKCPHRYENLRRSPVGAIATDAELRAAEAELQVPLPPVVRMVYATIGNGGFGPGDGLYTLHEALKMYRRNRTPDEVNYPCLNWPSGLLPICDWGCAIYSYVDCCQQAGPIYWFDYDSYHPEDPATHFSDLSAPVFLKTAESFQLWLEWWLDGTFVYGY